MGIDMNLDKAYRKAFRIINKWTGKPFHRHEIINKDLFTSYPGVKVLMNEKSEKVYQSGSEVLSAGHEHLLIEADESSPLFFFENRLAAKDGTLFIFANEKIERINAYRNNIPFNVKKIKGTVAYLSNSWIENYYHFLQFTLPLLSLYEQAVGLKNVDYYYIGNALVQPFHEEILKSVGIPRSKLVTGNCKPERLLCGFSQPETKESGLVRVAADFFAVRRLLASLPGKPAENDAIIYIKRGNSHSRKIINEEEVCRHLEEQGIKCVYTGSMSVSSQAALFSSAKMIIAPHGAALANLVFAREQAISLVEMFPEGYEEKSYQYACAFLDGAYFRMAFSADENGNFSINIPQLLEVISNIRHE